jgi:hypothetical protein
MGVAERICCKIRVDHLPFSIIHIYTESFIIFRITITIDLDCEFQHCIACIDV